VSGQSNQLQYITNYCDMCFNMMMDTSLRRCPSYQL
jgi:hypothetical protein